MSTINNFKETETSVLFPYHSWPRFVCKCAIRYLSIFLPLIPQECHDIPTKACTRIDAMYYKHLILYFLSQYPSCFGNSTIVAVNHKCPNMTIIHSFFLSFSSHLINILINEFFPSFCRTFYQRLMISSRLLLPLAVIHYTALHKHPY